MNPKKAKHKAHRKAIRIAQENAIRHKKKTIAKWIEEWKESRSEYPVTDSKKKRKRLTKEQYRKFLKTK